LLVYTGLLMMSLKALELRDHDIAGWDQCVAFLVRVCAGHEDLGKARSGGILFGRIGRSSDDQVMNDFSGPFDASGRDAAAVSVAQQEGACFRKPNGVGRLGEADNREESRAVATKRVGRMEDSDPISPPPA
jgi:hypothetical protein